MKTTHIALGLIGGALIALAGMDLAGCSSSSSNGSSSGGTKDGAAGDDGSSSGDGGGTGDDGGSTGKDAGSDCAAPATLHPSPDAGVYCPFQDSGVPDASRNCATGMDCCIYPKKLNHASECIANAGGDPSACPGFVADAGVSNFDCDEPADCTGGKVCCLVGTPTKDAVCGTYFGSRVLGTKCETACAAGEFQVCSSNTGECPSGQTCTAFSTKGKDLGACLQ